MNPEQLTTYNEPAMGLRGTQTWQARSGQGVKKRNAPPELPQPYLGFLAYLYRLPQGAAQLLELQNVQGNSSASRIVSSLTIKHPCSDMKSPAVTCTPAINHSRPFLPIPAVKHHARVPVKLVANSPKDVLSDQELFTRTPSMWRIDDSHHRILLMTVTNITHLISLLTNQRKETFAFERHIALMTFATWLQYPNDKAVLEHAAIVAAAACYIGSGGKRNPLATVENLSIALLASPLGKPLEAVSDSSTTLTAAITELVSFFLCCPPERKPSLNKALFFVEQGGFKYPDINDADDARSVATLKVAWKERANTGPFLWAMAIAGMGELYEILPDEDKAFQRVEKMIRNPKKVSDFFAISRFAQERLLSVVDKDSRHRFDVKFPKRFLAEECEFNPFDDRQLEILARYRAPQPQY